MEWILTQTRRLWTAIAQLLTTPVLLVGDTKFSIGSLIILGLLAIIIFIGSRMITEWLKQRLLTRLERGIREAIATISNYLLATFGLLILLQTAGIDLSSLAVLAGVLGIGVGFGLQNLASNFISGLTLLFEQPIKVGDFVEVDDLMGTVERISIRSTIIRTNDDVFVIVPNLRFVEQNIINWSYHAPRCRIHVPVAVAYGSDTVRVTEALLEAARQEPRVLTQPNPKVWFRAFGESALEFELLVWVDQPENSEPIRSALNFLIERELRYHQIEIPFPQQDVTVRNLEDLRSILSSTGYAPAASPSPHNSISPDRVASPPHPPSPAPSLSPTVSNWSLRDLLRRVTYFEGCSDLDLRQLIEYGYRQLFPANHVVCQENDPGNSFYIILAGRVEVFSQRTEKYIATLHAGEFFGEMSLLLGVPRSATVRTLEDSTLFVVDRDDLQKLLVNHAELADEIAQKLAERQQVLRDLGLMTEEIPSETPLIWVRKQLQSIFGI